MSAPVISSVPAKLDHGRVSRILFLFLVTLAALAFVPDLPFHQLDDPSHWGVLGFLGVVATMAIQDSWDLNRPLLRCLMGLFLAGLPAIYVANWIRWGGPIESLWVELAGLTFWVGLAIASRRYIGVIWFGVAAHAIWDAFHFGHTEYVPDWYIIACIAADLGLAGLLLIATVTRSALMRPSGRERFAPECVA